MSLNNKSLSKTNCYFSKKQYHQHGYCYYRPRHHYHFKEMSFDLRSKDPVFSYQVAATLGQKWNNCAYFPRKDTKNKSNLYEKFTSLHGSLQGCSAVTKTDSTFYGFQRVVLRRHWHQQCSSYFIKVTSCYRYFLVSLTQYYSPL